MKEELPHNFTIKGSSPAEHSCAYLPITKAYNGGSCWYLLKGESYEIEFWYF